jgi:hypothetical protein
MAESLLSNLRLGYACPERWDDMVGDDRVRDCGSCKRQVFNLSEMTRAEAEALLATHGLKPCVRFYRRPDGTVMTRDCPTGELRDRRRLAVVASSLAAGATLAIASPARADDADIAVPVDAVPAIATDHPASDPPLEVPPDPPIRVDGMPIELDHINVTMGIPVMSRSWEMGEIEVYEQRPKVEWSLWARLGVGLATPQSQNIEPDIAARRVTTPTEPKELVNTWEAALAADMTFPMSLRGDLRIGPWVELRTSSRPVAGGELVLEGLPPRPYSSHIGGSASVVLRAGANDRIITAAFGLGYTGSFSNPRPWVDWARHVVGARAVFSLNRAIGDPRNWSMTLGLEVEPIGALHALLDAF